MAFLGPSLRRKRVSARPGTRIAIAALASLAVNAALLLGLARLGAFELAGRGEPLRDVALEAFDAKSWAANRAIAGAQPPAATPPAPAPQAAPVPPRAPPAPTPPPVAEEEKHPRGQVVDVAPSPDSRRPDDARFLSERDNRVEKESRSRAQGTKVWERRLAAPSEGKPGQKPEAGEGGLAADGSPAREAGGGGGDGAQAAREPDRKAPQRPAPTEKAQPAGPGDRLAMLERPPAPGLNGLQKEPPAERQEEGLGRPGAPGPAGPPGSAQEQRRKLGDPRLLPSADSLSRITGGPSNDYIDDDSIEEGDATALNTRAFKFASFWNRFKADVAGHWRPAMVYNERDPNGTMFGSQRERLTGLHVVLDATGAVKEVKVVEPSGLDFLDREAVRAVRAASPYYNVPSGLVDGKGEVSFSFGMVLVMDRAVPVRPRYGR